MKKVSLIFSLFAIALMMLSGCGESVKESHIGKQVWMTENLYVDKFRNGDPIPHAKTIDEWRVAAFNGEPAWCYYDNDPANGEKYGKLYNWYAVNDPRGLAPEGWHVPSLQEWNTLIDHLGGVEVAGMKMIGFEKKSKNENDRNDFSALLAGLMGKNNEFGLLYDATLFWSSTEDRPEAMGVLLKNTSEENLIIKSFNKEIGASVRCIKDYSKN